MMESLRINVSTISFTQEDGQPKVHIRFTATNGQINMNGHVSVEQQEFFANRGSNDAMVELVRKELVELLSPTPVTQ